MEKPGLFDIMGDLSHGKKGLLYEDPSFEAEYSPYMVNLGFSQHVDSVLYANDMNRLHGLSKRAQHDFFFHGLDARKRFGKWAKKLPKPDDLEVVMEVFGVSQIKAMELIPLISPEKMDELKLATFKGGRA